MRFGEEPDDFTKMLPEPDNTILMSGKVSFESFHMFSDCNSSHSSSDDASINITDDIDEEYDEEHDI